MPDSPIASVLGINNNDHLLYYARAEFENGKHIGKKDSRWEYTVIPYGDDVQKVREDFEVLCCTKEM